MIFRNGESRRPGPTGWFGYTTTTDGQLIPDGELATLPVPLPLVATDSAKVLAVPKVAVTVAAAVKVTVQLPVPVQPPPLHPVKAEAPVGAAVSVTVLPELKLAWEQKLARAYHLALAAGNVR